MKRIFLLLMTVFTVSAMENYSSVTVQYNSTQDSIVAYYQHEGVHTAVSKYGNCPGHYRQGLIAGNGGVMTY